MAVLIRVLYLTHLISCSWIWLWLDDIFIILKLRQKRASTLIWYGACFHGDGAQWTIIGLTVCVCVCFLLLALLCVFVFVVFLYVSVGRLGVSVLLTFYIWYVFIERLWRTGCDPVGEEVVLDAAVCDSFVCGENNWTVFQMKTAQSDEFILEFCDRPSVCVLKRSRRFYRVSGGFNDGWVFLVRQNSDQLWLLCSL